MWPVLVEFRSASSEGSWRKKRKRSADSYVGRPNKRLVLGQLSLLS